MRVVVALHGVLLATVVTISSPPGKPQHGGQEAQGLPGAPQAQEPLGGIPLGTNQCTFCHGTGEAGTEAVARLAGPEARGFVTLQESPIWLQKDRHSRSGTLLDTPWAREIGERLGIPDVLKAEQCMVCHGSWCPQDSGPGFLADRDIGCQVCHGWAGTAEQPAPYYTLHQDPVRWRSLDPAEKQRLGMNDVRDRRRRAQLCTSCHLGHGSTMVNHDMYAAGHPLLPELEVQSWLQRMPPHWTEPARKGPRQNGDFLGAERWWPANHGVSSEERQSWAAWDRTRSAFLGVLVVQAQFLRLVWQYAERPSGDGWPELALFDCFACHHQLGQAQWRQGAGRAGRPRLRYACWPPVQAALTLAQYPVEPVEEVWRNMQEGLRSTPFGRPERLGQEAAALVEHLERAAEQLRRRPLSAGQVRAALGVLLEGAAVQPPDWEGARRISALVSAVLADLQGAGALGPGQAVRIGQVVEALEPMVGWPRWAGLEPIDQTSAIRDAMQGDSRYHPGEWVEKIQRISQLLAASEGPHGRP